MRGTAIVALASAALFLATAGAASAHPLGAGGGPPAFAPANSTAFEGPSGPCTEQARSAMPDGEGHDHLEIDQHAFECRLEQVAHLSLEEELGARPDVVLGEMDVEQDLAVVGVAYPEAGFLLFDVANPAEPRFLTWYRASECEGALIDVDCGAFVDLSSDGEVVFLSVQDISVLPGGLPPVGVRPASVPGVEVVDVSNPEAPRLRQVYPVASFGGVHASRSHVIEEGPAAGEYLFSVANSFGFEITKVNRTPLGPQLTRVARVETEDIHDTFIQNDPLDGRTYLYIAAEFRNGFIVFDVTNPAEPKRIAEWDVTPECGEDWYAHTIDVAVRNDRRFVTLGAELFDGGEQSEEDQAEGCGEIVGNGDKPGPLWIVDATDFDALPDQGDDDETIKEKSEEALVTTWTNPANRAGGNLTFSPHNQQIVGDKIYLSNYHGGVYVLDASAAFRGQEQRPTELAFHVPHASDRPIPEADVGPLLIPFFQSFLTAKPLIWDTFFYKGHVLAADMLGGFYSFREVGEPPVAAGRSGR